ncbi:hypothetical protein L6R49_26375 [Myxococcota bacterium]|nr:hypothetical protein [Myxococcota bacterium]
MPQSRHARAALLFMALLAWTMGLGARLVHRIEVTHVVCAAHGALMELNEAPTSVAANDEARPDDGQDEDGQGDDSQDDDSHEDHDHDCSLDGVSAAALASAPPALGFPWALAQAHDDRAARLPLARGPPLAFAPKTSPPVRRS